MRVNPLTKLEVSIIARNAAKNHNFYGRHIKYLLEKQQNIHETILSQLGPAIDPDILRVNTIHILLYRLRFNFLKYDNGSQNRPF